MNRRRVLIIGGLGIVFFCACASILLFLPEREETTTEVVERASGEIEDEQIVEAPTINRTEVNSINPTATARVVKPTSKPTELPAPTDEPTPTEEPTPTPVPVQGMSRGNPFPLDALVEAPNWDVQVLEVIRGEDAWTQIQAANRFNEPPPEGMEYLLVRVKATSTYSDADSHGISGSDFAVTGDQLQRYSRAFVVTMDPELDADLFSGGETEGWIPFAIGQGEGSLILIVDELLNFDDDRFRFIALEEGASIFVDSKLSDIDPSSQGASRTEPVALGETATTEDWEITITEVIHGDEAWSAVQNANQFNEPPAEGMEYVAAKLLVRYIGTTDRAVNISGAEFDLTGEANLLYNWPSIVDPEPSLDVYLFPGGQYEGWTVMEARQGEEDLMVRFEPLFEFSDENIRYLAIDDGASVPVPRELSEIEPNDLGKDRDEPTPLGQTAIGENWEFTILEVVRGDNALTMVQEANQFNELPDPGMEYVAIMVRVRNINTEDVPERISDSFFSSVDEANVEFDLPPVVEPEPALDIALYPGGEFEGWVVLQASEGSSRLIAIISPIFSFDTYYMALEP